MIKLIRGAKFEGCDRLFEGYRVQGNTVEAVVDADKLMKVIFSFVEGHENEPFFIFFEVPCNVDREAEIGDGRLHKDIYRTGVISSDTVKRYFRLYEEILVNDGMIAFGVCTPKGEIGKYQYNMMCAFSNSDEPMKGAFEQNGIREAQKLIMPWLLFTKDCPGESSKYLDGEGRSVYDVMEALNEVGLHLAYTEEES